MPEARDRLMDGGIIDLALRFGILGAGRHPQIGTPFQSPLADNKENIPPERSGSRRRPRGRERKSPLPAWYPRTPLRDISAVVNALQRKENRRRAASELRSRNEQPENSSLSPSVTGPSTPELNESGQLQHPTQVQEPKLNLSKLFPDSVLIEKASARSADNTLESFSPADTSASSDKRTVKAVKVSDSIDEIDRILTETFQRLVDLNTKKSTGSSLMAMR